MKFLTRDAVASAVALALLFLPVASLVLPRTPTQGFDVAASPLSARDENMLREVKRGVKSLKVPGQPRQALRRSKPTSIPSAGSCTFMGKLLTADLSARCCTNVQVISQKQLSYYGAAQPCKPGWDCGPDGLVPKPSFEAQSIRELCGEPGCLPAVVGAMRTNWMTAEGADEMSGICTSLASSLGKDSSAGELSASLHRAAVRASRSPNYEDHTKRDDDDDPAEQLECQEEVCSDHKEKEKVCGEPEADGKPANKTHMCYKHCCESSFFAGQGLTNSGCFAGEATADVQGRGPVPMAELHVGDHVLVENSGQLLYEPILTFLHSLRPAHGARSHFMTIVHSYGEFQATENHIIFVAADIDKANVDPHQRVSRLVGKLTPGDWLMATDPDNPQLVRYSRVLAVRHSSGESGVYAPLTAAGTIVVDGVVASNYASPNAQTDLTHRTAHAFLLPVRLYHFFGIKTLLHPFWQHFCGTSSHWLCLGDHLDAARKSAVPVKIDELHPYLAVMYRGFRVDKLLFLV